MERNGSVQRLAKRSDCRGLHVLKSDLVLLLGGMVHVSGWEVLFRGLIGGCSQNAHKAKDLKSITFDLNGMAYVPWFESYRLQMSP